MLTLNGTSVNSVPSFKSLRFIGDLIYYEGPLLSLFYDPVLDETYLFDWEDKDATHNRWFIYRVEVVDIKSFVERTISCSTLFSNAKDGVYYSVDIDVELNESNMQKLTQSQLPNSYKPIVERYFDEDDCTNLKEVMTFIL